MPRITLPYYAPGATTNMSLTTDSLATYVFTHNPQEMKRIRKERIGSSLETLETIAFFDWGIKAEQEGLAGRRFEMTWPYMGRTDFNELKDYYESSEVVTWDAQRFAHNATSLYEVEVISLESTDMPQNTLYMKDVSLVLEIRKVKNR